MAAPARRTGPALGPSLLWAVFANCAVISAIIVPATVLVLGVLAPAGVVPAFDRHYDTFAPALANWLVKIGLFILVATAFYTFGHRVRYLLTDLGVRAPKTPLSLLVYGVAGAGIVVAAVILAGVP